MRIREYSDADLARIKLLHSKHAFELPDPADARVVIRKCVVDEKGIVRLAAFGRAQLNAYLFIDDEWRTPEERLEAIEILETAMIEQARILGFDQTTAQVEPRFGQRLKNFGWGKSPGETWHKEF
jgi:hypothetical protein